MINFFRPKKSLRYGFTQYTPAKLEHYGGVRGTVHSPMKSYLRGRKQYVDINGSHSTIKVVLQGIPQGSNLGPTLFSIHVNGIFNNFNFYPVLYADYTCLNVAAPI